MSAAAAVVVAVGVIGAVAGSGDSDKTKSASNARTTNPSAAVAPSATTAPSSKSAQELAAESRSAVAKASASKASAAAAKAAEAKAAASAAAASKAAAAAKAAAERPVAISTRDFAKLVKDPDSYAGRHFIVYGEVTQFDAATGTEAFLADSGANKKYPEYGFVDYSDNALFHGEASALADVVEGDLFQASVEVVGSFSYDTQIGGNTTVPEFLITKISVYGSTNE